MKNSGVSNIDLERHMFRVGDSSQRFSGTFGDRNMNIKMRCTSRIENGSTMMMHRQQLVLQAPAATCSVDSSSHESLMESLSDRSTTCAFDYSNSATCAQNSDLTLRESQTNDSHASDAEVGINQPVPWRYQQWNHKLKSKPKTKKKRRRLRQ
jgi:hypothetical protein